MDNLRDRSWGLLLIIVGLGLVIYGISGFIVPLSSIAGGLLIINQGLKIRNLPSLEILIKYLFLKFR